jgi:hypothetical protein
MENIFTSSKPLLTFGNLMGFVPVAFRGPARNGDFTVKRFSTATQMLPIGMFLFIILSENGNFMSTENLSFLSIASHVFLSAEMYYFTLVLLHQACIRENLLKFLQTLKKVDDEVRGIPKLVIW